jgi:hypothetical protein
MPVPSHSTSAGPLVVLDTARLPCSLLPPAAKKTRSDCLCPDGCVPRGNVRHIAATLAAAISVALVNASRNSSCVVPVAATMRATPSPAIHARRDLAACSAAVRPNTALSSKILICNRSRSFYPSTCDLFAFNSTRRPESHAAYTASTRARLRRPSIPVHRGAPLVCMACTKSASAA